MVLHVGSASTTTDSSEVGNLSSRLGLKHAGQVSQHNLVQSSCPKHPRSNSHPNMTRGGLGYVAYSVRKPFVQRSWAP